MSIDIVFDNLFAMSLDPQEMEEHIPSVCFAFSFKKTFASTVASIDSRLWFRCADFDQFSKALTDNSSAGLVSLGEELSIKVADTDSRLKNFVLTLYRKSRSGDVIKMSFECTLDDDQIAMLRNAFSGFERWW